MPLLRNKDTMYYWIQVCMSKSILASKSTERLLLIEKPCLFHYPMSTGVAVGSEFCGPESPAIQDPSFWVVSVGASSVFKLHTAYVVTVFEYIFTKCHVLIFPLIPSWAPEFFLGVISLSLSNNLTYTSIYCCSQ